MTDGKNGEITSFFYDNSMWIHAFKASFTYTDVGSTGVANGTCSMAWRSASKILPRE